MHKKFLQENLKKGDHYEDIDVGLRANIKMDLK
jgi:hypothetical protein